MNKTGAFWHFFRKDRVLENKEEIIDSFKKAEKSTEEFFGYIDRLLKKIEKRELETLR